MVKKINKPDETPQSVETSENGVNKQTSTNDELAGELSLSSKKNPMKISIPLSPDEEHIAFFDQYTEKLCDAIEYTTFEHDSYPGVYKKGVWESTDSIEEDTFVLAISYYDNNLYTITVLSTDWNQEEHPWSSYPHEMIELFKQVAEKWNVSFPLLEDDFKTSKIIVNKAQLDEFLEDMKMDATKIFKHPAKAMDTVNSSFIQTDDGYEIKNIFPTDVSDKGTFSLQHESLEDTDNGEIYTSCLKQNIA